MKACAFAPEGRYNTAEEFRKDLEKLRANPNAKIDTPPLVKKILSRKKKIAAVISAAVFAVCGIIYGLIPKVPEDISGIGPSETMYIFFFSFLTIHLLLAIL